MQIAYGDRLKKWPKSSRCCIFHLAMDANSPNSRLVLLRFFRLTWFLAAVFFTCGEGGGERQARACARVAHRDCNAHGSAKRLGSFVGVVTSSLSLFCGARARCGLWRTVSSLYHNGQQLAVAAGK